VLLSGLLLDSADTLIRPRGGRWNPRFDFEEVLVRHGGDVPAEQLGRAFAAGDSYMRDWAKTVATVGHAAARANYHRTILAAVGIDDPSAALLGDLDRPLPFAELVEPFADTAEGLARLREDGWRIAIVADTSSHMVDVYREFGLAWMIETFVISAEIGFSKPDPRMYWTATERLELQPDECVFVDNDPENLDGALRLGYHSVGMARYSEPPHDTRTWVRNLDELRSRLRELRTTD
jgi:FMN phosphatase YigB (HAD superfamily)